MSENNMPTESMMDIPNSLIGPADFSVGGESLELLRINHHGVAGVDGFHIPKK